MSAQGFGAMGLSHAYGRADEAESIRTLRRAIELGITFFDTATGYGEGHNEQLLGRAITGRRDDLVIASKFTHRRARELGIAFVAYSPLGRGFLAGAAPVEESDRRNIHPRFTAEAIAVNGRRRRTVEDVAERLRVSPAQVSLAWVLAQGVVPIPGTRHVRHLEDNWAAGGLQLDEGTIEELEGAFPIGATVGDRYPAEQMKAVPADPVPA